MSSQFGINPRTNLPFSDNYLAQHAKAKNLPVTKDLPEIERVVDENKVVILVGETGSGKTTQVPPIFLSRLRPGKKIALTQPRKLAAKYVNIPFLEYVFTLVC